MKSGIKTNLTGEILVALLLISCLFLVSCVNHEGNRKTRELVSKVENGLVQQVIIEGDSVQHFNIEERMSHYKTEFS